MEKIMATVVFLLGVLILSLNVKSHAKESNLAYKTLLRPIENELEIEYPKLQTLSITSDTLIPKEKSARGKRQRVIQRQKGKEDIQYDVTVEDGEITELLINGEPVPPEEYKNYETITNGEDGSFVIPSPPTIPTDLDVPPPPPAPPTFFDIDEESEIVIKAPSVVVEGGSGTTVTTSKNEEGKTVVIIKNPESGEEEIIEMEGDDPNGRIFLKEGNVIIGGGTVIKSDKKKGYSYSYKNGSYSYNYNHFHKAKEEALYERLAEIKEKQKALIEQKNRIAEMYQEQSAEQAEAARERAIEMLAQVKALENETRAIEKSMEQKERAIARAYRHQERAQQRGFQQKSKNLQRVLESTMLRDGLIQDNKNYKFELDDKKLRVNGKKQSDQLWNKYKALYESLSGNQLNKKGRITIEVEENKNSRNSNSNITIDCDWKN